MSFFLAAMAACGGTHNESNVDAPLTGDGHGPASDAPGPDAPKDGPELGNLAQQAYVKASNTDSLDAFGWSVALSADGSTLAVGASGEASAATGIDGNQADNSAASAGAVYVYVRSGTSWSQQAYVKASNTEAGDLFGTAVTLSADGSTLVVGAPHEASAARGIDGNGADNSAEFAGAAYVFARTGTGWSQQAYLKASNTNADAFFGYNVSIAADGTTLAVTSFGESSAATGVGGNQSDTSAADSGAVYVFTRTGTSWSQQAYVKASNTEANDVFGSSVALSGDGANMVVGALAERSSAIGVGGNQADNSVHNAGAAYMFTRAGTTWSQQAYLKASNTGIEEEFGTHVALAADGSTLAVSAPPERSAATGIDGDQADTSANRAGAVYLFTRVAGTWSQQAYLKASNTASGDLFGDDLAITGDGDTLAICASGEAGAAPGIDGDQSNNNAQYAGAIYLLGRTGQTWSQLAYVKASNPEYDDHFCTTAFSSDGSTLAIGAQLEDSAATGIGGNQADNTARDSGAVYLFR